MCLLAEALVLEEEVKGLGLLTVVGDTDTRAGNDLAGVTLGIDLAETSPLTAPRAPEVLSGRDV